MFDYHIVNRVDRPLFDFVLFEMAIGIAFVIPGDLVLFFLMAPWMTWLLDCLLRG